MLRECCLFSLDILHTFFDLSKWLGERVVDLACGIEDTEASKSARFV